jgi:hypothetical protein
LLPAASHWRMRITSSTVRLVATYQRGCEAALCEAQVMYVSEYDPLRVILFGIHVDGPLSDADVDRIAASTRRAVDDAARQGTAVTSLIVIESRYGPTSEQRKRLGEATALIKRGHIAFVVRSALIRAVISAIGWFKQGNPENVHSTHANYEDARKWLVTHTGHPAHVFDALERKVRSRVQKALEQAS